MTVEEPDANPCDHDLMYLLQRREGQLSLVTLADGRALQILNIAWGYDTGDAYAHVTTHISPAEDDMSVDFFYANEIADVHDNAGHRLWPPPH